MNFYGHNWAIGISYFECFMYFCASYIFCTFLHLEHKRSETIFNFYVRILLYVPEIAIPKNRSSDFSWTLQFSDLSLTSKGSKNPATDPKIIRPSNPEESKLSFLDSATLWSSFNIQRFRKSCSTYESGNSKILSLQESKLFLLNTATLQSNCDVQRFRESYDRSEN